MYVLAEENAHKLKCFFYLQLSFTRQSVTTSCALFINNVRYISQNTAIKNRLHLAQPLGRRIYPKHLSSIKCILVCVV